MLQQYEKTLYGDEHTQSAGRHLAEQLRLNNALSGAVITLSGELGAGKTTFSRGFIRQCGYQGAVKSPTYTLIETYSGDECEICHLDLYRLDDPDELEYIGFRDLLGASVVMLVEWPERVPSIADLATVVVELQHRDEDSRQIIVHSQWTLSPE